jgi:hypothetical protein
VGDVTVIDKRRRPAEPAPPEPLTETQERAVALWVKQQAALAWWAVQGAAQRGDTERAAEIAARRGQLLDDAVRQGVDLT